MDLSPHQLVYIVKLLRTWCTDRTGQSPQVQTMRQFIKIQQQGGDGKGIERHRNERQRKRKEKKRV